MTTKAKSRRSFLVNSVTGLNAAWITANLPGILAAQEYARQPAGAPALAFFTPAQAAEVEAMAAQIIPTDDTPGAREARCRLLHRQGSDHFRPQQPASLYARVAGSPGEDGATLPERRQVLGAHFRAADQNAHGDREDAVLQHGPHAHGHWVLCAPGARRQPRQDRLEADRLRRFAES